MMRKLLSGLVFCVGLQGAALADVMPDVMVRDLTVEVVKVVSQDKDLRSGNAKKVHALVETRILPLFDFVHMAQLAVGKHWRSASPEQQASLVDAFRTLLVRTYSASMSSIVEYSFDWKPLRMRPGDTDVTVSLEVSKSGAPPIPLSYSVEKQGNTWKIYDVTVDGVSLVTVYRGSFNSEIRKGGVDGLIAALNRRIEK
jgi:phospholipid transport system substrate-binding protein